MPKINVYLSEDLAAAVRQAGVPISAVCQRALADAVAVADIPPGNAEDAAADIGTLDLSRFTRRAREAVDCAQRSSAHPTSVHLLAGILAEGHNMALAVLRALDIDPVDLVTEVKARAAAGTARVDGVDAVFQRAAEEAITFGHNYIGCEHLLLGLVAGADDEVVAHALHSMDVDLTRTRQAVKLMLDGMTFARDSGLSAGLSAPIRSALDEIRSRLARLEAR